MGLVFMTMAGYNPDVASQLLAKDVRRKEWLYAGIYEYAPQ